MGEILDSLQGLYDYFTTGTYTFVQEIFASLMIWFVTWSFKVKIAMMGFMWGVGQAMLDQLNISTLIDTYWGQLDSALLGFASRYNLPEALNLVMNATITRFIWNML
ncbi:MAG: DUF2523 family protein [Motiliproteus sp.]